MGKASELKNVMVDRRLLYPLRLLGSVVLLGIVFVRYDVLSVIQDLRQLHLLWLMGSLVLPYVGFALNSVRWKLTLQSYGRSQPFGRLWRLYLESAFFNLMGPGFVAGDLSRAVRTSRDGTQRSEAFLAVLLERFSGYVVASVYIGVMALVGGYNALGDAWRTAIVAAPVLLWAAIAVVFSLARADVLLRTLPAPLARLAGKTFELMRHTGRAVRRRPWLFLRQVGLSLCYLLLTGPMAYGVARAVGVELPFAAVMSFAPLIAVASNLPITIAGVGVREHLAVALYASVGLSPEAVVIYALTQSALVLVVNMSGGLALLFRWVRPSPAVEGEGVEGAADSRRP